VSEQLPAPSSARIKATALTRGDVLVIKAGTRLLRVHPLGGPHPVAWNQFRSFGPTAGRFDHQHPPPRTSRTRRVAYFTYGADAFIAALAESYQDGAGTIGPLDLTRHAPHVSMLETARPLKLLDLSSGWVTRAGGNQAICSGSRRRAQEWARAIYQHHKASIDGLAYASSVWGPGRCVALWEQAEDAIPNDVLAHRALNDSALVDAVAHAAKELGTYIV
jgi:hypothetical protein